MIVAALQTRPRRGRAQDNLDRLCQAVDATDAHLLVAPELALSGYHFLSPGELRPWALPRENPAFDRLVEHHLKPRNRHLVLGFAEADGDRLFNSAALLGPKGLLAVYRKTHLFDAEKDLFSPGDTGFFVTTLSSGVKVGMMICFDWFFPESARSLSLLGADLIAHPSNLVLPWCQSAMPVRALENRVFTVTANRVGTERNGQGRLRFTGGSIMVNPLGRVLAKAGRTAVQVISADIDPAQARDKSVTPRNHCHDDRRPSKYVKMC